MLHIEFPYLRVAKIPLIPLRAFLAHLLHIDEMGFRAFHVDIILEMGEQVTLIVHSSVLISQNYAYSMPITSKSASLQYASELQQSHGRDRCAR